MLSNVFPSFSANLLSCVSPDGKCIAVATRLVGIAVSFITLRYTGCGVTPRGLVLPKSK